MTIASTISREGPVRISKDWENLCRDLDQQPANDPHGAYRDFVVTLRRFSSAIAVRADSSLLYLGGFLWGQRDSTIFSEARIAAERVPDREQF